LSTDSSKGSLAVQNTNEKKDDKGKAQGETSKASEKNDEQVLSDKKNE